jgi:hypothetical protein
MSSDPPIEMRNLLPCNMDERDRASLVDERLNLRVPIHTRFGRFVRSPFLYSLSTRTSHSHLAGAPLTLQALCSSLIHVHLIDSASPAPQSTLPCKQKALAPRSLRWTSLLGLIGFVASLITILEVISHFSKKNQGIAASTNNTQYIWKYCPTASKYEHTRQSHRL